MDDLVYGLDFGTSNSSIAIFKDDKVIPVPCGSNGRLMMSSVLFFPQFAKNIYVGDEAVSMYIAMGMQGRFIQSIKSTLPLKWFINTRINDEYFEIDDLVSLILADLKLKADKMVGNDIKKVVLGRPAVFSRIKEEEVIAETRLLSAAKIAGFKDIYLQVEPIAAAISYESSLSEPELVLVADFGGGTSDFTLMKLSPDKTKSKNRIADILGTAGVDIAGDSFDSKIMWHKLTKYFGAGSKWMSWDKKWNNIPLYLMRTICEWHQIPFLKNNRREWEFIQRLRLYSDNKEAAIRLNALIERNLGFSLFRAIERAKRYLSEREEEEIIFDTPPINICESITRAEFENIISEDIKKIGDCLEKLLVDSNVPASAVSSVFLTGGSSYVPRIVNFLKDKFRRSEIRRGDAFLSVVSGLAMSSRLFS